MAEAQIQENIQDIVTWYKHQGQRPSLSFVFKINHIEIKASGCEPKLLQWNSFIKQPTDDNIRQCFKNNIDEMDLADKDYGEGLQVDETIQRAAAMQVSFVQNAMFALFSSKGWQPEEVSWYIQCEWGTDTKLHTHLILSHPEIKPVHGKWLAKYFADKYSKAMLSCCSHQLTMDEKKQIKHLIETGDWVTVLTYTHKQTKKKYTKPVDFTTICANYFLQKNIVQTERTEEGLRYTPGYFFSLDSAFHINGKSVTHRKKIAKLLQKDKKPEEQPTTSTQVTTRTAPQAKRARLETQKEMSMKETIDTLFKNRICSIEDWQLKDPDSYVHHIAQSGGELIAKSILDIASLKLSRELTAYDLIKEKPHDTPDSLNHLKIWEIFTSNNMNPFKVIHAIMCCLNKEAGKRNSIYFHGPASTGKSLIAQHMCTLVGNMGCYNPANQNFPFNDCCNKNVIWIEEAGNFGQQVNQFKSICSGQAIRIDQKGKGSKTIEPTPVVITTNEDLTQVIVGCERRPEHTQPIKDRLLPIKLTSRLPGDFGLLDKKELPTIFNWMETHGFLPTMANYMHLWGAVPTWGENWAEPPIKDFQLPGSTITSPEPLTPTDEALEELLSLWDEDPLEVAAEQQTN
ncbi:NS1 [California sea lion parvovirus]|uniref:Initiator protein NS1 n=1 Tax=California sea lion parvovirus Hanchett TaxID=3070204 RepID=A0A7D5T368_9VIRU|nr:NS1 [California sea lion parvovirus]QLH64628.1 NS1 [California sea lion parvovirus]